MDWNGLMSIIATIMIGNREMVLPAIHITKALSGSCFQGPRAIDHPNYSGERRESKEIGQDCNTPLPQGSALYLPSPARCRRNMDEFITSTAVLVAYIWFWSRGIVAWGIALLRLDTT